MIRITRTKIDHNFYEEMKKEYSSLGTIHGMIVKRIEISPLNDDFTTLRIEWQDGTIRHYTID